MATSQRDCSGLDQKVSSPVRGLARTPTRTSALPVYRANLNHPVNIAEHGNAVGPDPARRRANLTVRRVRGNSFGTTEKAKASGNALDRPTSVWSEMARKHVEPILTGKANDDRRSSVDASRSAGLKGHARIMAASEYCQVALRPRGVLSSVRLRVSPTN